MDGTSVDGRLTMKAIEETNKLLREIRDLLLEQRETQRRPERGGQVNGAN